MSSNIRIEKICQFCFCSFIAKTIVTKYCSHRCNQKAYKRNKKNDKLIEASQQIISKGEQVLLSKEFLSIPDAARLAGVSERTIFRMICRRLIHPVRQGRKVSIKINDILKRKTYEHLY